MLAGIQSGMRRGYHTSKLSCVPRLEKKSISSRKEVRKKVLAEGDNKTFPVKGQTVAVHYTGVVSTIYCLAQITLSYWMEISLILREIEDSLFVLLLA